VVRGYALDIIEKRRREGYSAPRKDLLQWFLEAKDDEGNPLSGDLLVDYILSFSVMRLDSMDLSILVEPEPYYSQLAILPGFQIAGRDTTAQALTWMFYSIYRDVADKDIAKILIKEGDDVLQGGDPTYESYKQQKYAEAW